MDSERALRSSSNSGSSAGSSEAIAVVPQQINPLDWCLWYPGYECSLPRSCYDCLNSNETKGRCTVDAVGRCVSMALYESTSDYRSNQAEPASHYYPSTNTSYCSGSQRGDVCSAWATTINSSRAKTTGDHCVGTAGCVRIAACESSARNGTLLELCYTLSATSSGAGTREEMYLLAILAATAMTVLVFVFTGRWRRLNLPAASYEDEPPLRPRNPRYRRYSLNLEGWKSMRQKLIDDELSTMTHESHQNEKRVQSHDSVFSPRPEQTQI